MQADLLLQVGYWLCTYKNVRGSEVELPHESQCNLTATTACTDLDCKHSEFAVLSYLIYCTAVHAVQNVQMLTSGKQMRLSIA